MKHGVGFTALLHLLGKQANKSLVQASFPPLINKYTEILQSSLGHTHRQAQRINITSVSPVLSQIHAADQPSC